MNNDVLTKYGLKNTPTRQEVLKVLSHANHPLTAEEISKKIKNIDTSTLYRTLNKFTEVGIIRKEVNQNKENIFSYNSEKEDNHILVCLKCHKIVPIEGCPYHEVNEEIEKETGFILNDHHTEIYGVCPDCQKHK